MVHAEPQPSGLRSLPELAARRTNLQKMQTRRHGRSCLEAALTAVVSTVGLFLGLAVSIPPSAAAGSSGTFVFSGYISGTLRVPAYLPSSDHTDCSITASNLRTDIPDTEVFNWNGVELKVGGKSKRISFIDLQIQVSKFGRIVVMTAEDGSSDSVFFSTGAPYNWLSESGTIATVKSGSSGSVHGALSAGSNHSGTVTIKGHWEGCTILHN
jgi:hypothetical protein